MIKNFFSFSPEFPKNSCLTVLSTANQYIILVAGTTNDINLMKPLERVVWRLS